MINWNLFSGLNLRNVRVDSAQGLLLCLLLLTSFTSHAEQQNTPSMEFLEFLGEGVKVDGEYLDPVNYDDIGTNSLAARTDTTKTDDKSKAQDDEK